MERQVADVAFAPAVWGVDGAYQRSHPLERRRIIMQEWADYVLSARRQPPDALSLLW